MWGERWLELEEQNRVNKGPMGISYLLLCNNPTWSDLK